MAQQFDYIIVGAGAAGCIVASRLTEDPHVNVLLVEAGGSDRRPFIAMPGGLPFVYQNKKIGWGYQSGPEPHLNGKVIDEKAGRIIGGSTSINAMIYNRGNPMDYDGWAEKGLEDWDYAHCLPYFRKSETFSGGSDEFRGGDGPMHISRARAAHKLFEASLRGAEEAGFGVTSDHNGYQQEGFHVAQSFIHNGVRWSAPRAYLRPALQRPNLRLMSKTHVNRILVQGGAAIGIEVAAPDGPRSVVCEREVVVCAGAVNTPKLLLLSGLGPGEELRRHDIDVLVDIPGVGRNLQNHPGVDIQYSTRYEDSLTSELNHLGRVRLGADWILRRKGLGTTNFFETGAFLRTREDVGFPNMQYEFLPLTRKLENGKLIPVPGFQFWMDLSRPESRGSVTLQSRNPADPPRIVFNTYESRQDMRDMIDGIRLIRDRLVRQPAMQRFRPRQLNPGPDVDSDHELEVFIRKATGTSYHPSGTCRMGTDADAVVDGAGRVNAVRGMRIVDASIMPKVVTGNLNAPVMMLAEKIADQIRGRKPLAPSTAAYYRAPR
ncbi:choline dehydrogenase [Streptomyces sp. NPDC057376]|uniref:choline dehydrogenase n=1 Tax=unclassified Streptomyces TaxID=2593676 RepID=UPI00093C2423|nr:choline dehydrogenase [Streptomyces sp. CB02414]OKI86063.1 choline dehydrogenase [Streptomyces sp. CB02414]